MHRQCIILCLNVKIKTNLLVLFISYYYIYLLINLVNKYETLSRVNFHTLSAIASHHRRPRFKNQLLHGYSVCSFHFHCGSICCQCSHRQVLFWAYHHNGWKETQNYCHNNLSRMEKVLQYKEFSTDLSS